MRRGISAIEELEVAPDVLLTLMPADDETKDFAERVFKWIAVFNNGFDIWMVDQEHTANSV